MAGVHSTSSVKSYFDFLIQVVFDFSIINVGSVDDLSPKDIHNSLRGIFFYAQLYPAILRCIFVQNVNGECPFLPIALLLIPEVNFQMRVAFS